MSAFRSAYSSPVRSSVVFHKPSLTKQAHAGDCDINNIIRRYSSTGQIHHVNPLPPQYGEVASVDFQSAMNLVLDAQDSFESLPSDLRKRFSNDPAVFLDFIADASNRDEAIKWGIIDAPVEPSIAPDPSPDPIPEE